MGVRRERAPDRGAPRNILWEPFRPTSHPPTRLPPAKTFGPRTRFMAKMQSVSLIPAVPHSSCQISLCHAQVQAVSVNQLLRLGISEAHALSEHPTRNQKAWLCLSDIWHKRSQVQTQDYWNLPRTVTFIMLNLRWPPGSGSPRQS